MRDIYGELTAQYKIAEKRNARHKKTYARHEAIDMPSDKMGGACDEAGATSAEMGGASSKADVEPGEYGTVSSETGETSGRTGGALDNDSTAHGELAISDMELLDRAPDDTWFYALSPDRINAIEFFPFRQNDRILEIGADYGVFAPIAERTASFDILDVNEEHREFIRTRYSKLAGLRLIASPAPASYDVVILSLLDDKGISDAAAAAGKAAEYLKEGGALILIADNSGAMRYMTGDDPISGRTYIRLADIGRIADATGLDIARQYYPLNGAAFARIIYSSEKLPGKGDFRGINESFEHSRLIFCKEEAVYAAIAEAGAFPAFAPSYIVVYSNDPKLRDRMPVYAKYNRMRNERYALKTEIFSDRRVVKTALNPAANAHIEGFDKRARILGAGSGQTESSVAHDNIEEPHKKTSSVDSGFGSETASSRLGSWLDAASGGSGSWSDAASGRTGGFRIIPLPAKISKNALGLSQAEFEFIEGSDLASVLEAGIENGKAPEDKLNKAINVILGPKGQPCHNLDALFENVLISSTQAYLIDYEWVSGRELDREYLKYRMLRYWYEAHEAALSAYDGLEDFLGTFGISADKAAGYASEELSFQAKVRGRFKELEHKFIKNQLYTYDVKEKLQQLKESLERIDMLSGENESLQAVLKKEREIERLSQNHIRNIEKINSINAKTIEELGRRNEYLNKHRSLYSRLSEAMIRRIDAWAPAGSRNRAMIHLIKDIVKHPSRLVNVYLKEEGRILVSGEHEIGEEFRDGGILTLPHTDKPLVSIVIPVYNQIAYTYGCIRSIISNTDFEETPYEVILADDVSTDATREIDKYIKGLVISRNSSNMGFLKNCNQAAAKAKGKYIFFLNNDTKVHQGWLSSLVELMESDESIGMAGSKLVYPDGRLQEAGGIIWSDASGWNYGRLDDPEKPEYNYVKDVDYISGAAIMIHKSLWEEIGGFDERFAPAYCEDSDLAFEVRKHGSRVVFEPRSVVTHFEGISNGTDVEGTGLKRYQVVNAEKFREKWAAELKNHEVNDGNPDPFTARDRTSGKPCVVIVDHYVPTWDKDAGSKTTYQYIKMFLKKGFNVKFVGDNFMRAEPYTGILQQMGVEVLYGPDYEEHILEWFKKHSRFIDFCYLNRPHISIKYIEFLKKEADIKCIFYGHDLHFMRLRREYELTGDTAKIRESEYFKGLELSVMEQADMVYYPSEEEINAIHKIRPEIPAKAITAYMWDEFKPADNERKAYEQKKDLLFVGGFRHPPNADAVKWFVGKIFPEVRKAIPGICFKVAGSGAGEDILKLNDPENGINILGFVSDEELERLYHDTRVIVVPLRYGAGVKGKVVEALYNNTAIITTSVGAEGIPEAENAMIVVNERNDDIKDRPEEVERNFINELIRLYNDTDECMNLSLRCGDFIRKYYSLDAAWDVVKEDVLKMCRTADT